jgi:glutamate synthase (NADPH/NADH) large chain
VAWGFRVPGVSENFRHQHGDGGAEQPDPQSYAAGLASTAKTGGTGAAYNRVDGHMGHPIASNLRDVISRS